MFEVKSKNHRNMGRKGDWYKELKKAMVVVTRVLWTYFKRETYFKGESGQECK